MIAQVTTTAMGLHLCRSYVTVIGTNYIPPARYSAHQRQFIAEHKTRSDVQRGDDSRSKYTLT